MFKKYAKGFFDKEVAETSTHLSDPNLDKRFAEAYVPSSQPSPMVDEIKAEVEMDEPETIIGEHVSLRGTLTYQRLIRIDGTFEGELITDGKLIIGPTGVVKADLNLEEAFISGKVEGNITVRKRLNLRGRAEIKGDITAPLLSVDEGVSITGSMHIVPSDNQDL